MDAGQWNKISLTVTMRIVESYLGLVNVIYLFVLFSHEINKELTAAEVSSFSCFYFNKKHLESTNSIYKKIALTLQKLLN